MLFRSLQIISPSPIDELASKMESKRAKNPLDEIKNSDLRSFEQISSSQTAKPSKKDDVEIPISSDRRIKDIKTDIENIRRK